MDAQRRSRVRSSFLLAALTLAGMGLAAFAGAPSASPPPFRVKIEDGKAGEGEIAAAGDGRPHCQVIAGPNMSFGLRLDTQDRQPPQVYSWFNIDGTATFPGNSGVEKVVNGPLPRLPNNRKRVGHTSVWERNQLTITQEIEVVASRGGGAGAPRRDAVLVRYVVHNKGTASQKVGMRVHTDQTVNGLVFAAPNEPKKRLDGVELKGAKVPRSLRMSATKANRPDNTVAHVTCNLGTAFEQPGRVVLTSMGSVGGVGRPREPVRGQWGAGAVLGPARDQAGRPAQDGIRLRSGHRDPCGGRRRFHADARRLVPPGKLFGISAHVPDPAVGQCLTLELPDGVQHVEGKERQPVPMVDEDGHALVLWKARVLRPGRFEVRVRSSTGITHSKIVTITRS